MTGEESMRVHGEIERLQAELAAAQSELERARPVVAEACQAYRQGGIDGRSRLARSVRALLDAERRR